MRPHFRHSAAQKARRLWSEKPVFLDTETTGLSDSAEIVEISIIDTDGSLLLDTLVRPVRPIPPDAMRVHNISNDMVSTAPTWMRVWPQVEGILHGRTVGIYNADFDLRMFKQSHKQVGMPWRTPGSHFFCIMKLYADFIGSRRWQRLSWAPMPKPRGGPAGPGRSGRN